MAVVKTGNELSALIGEIGYDILDDFVGPAAGAHGIVADLYLADIRTYFMFSDEAPDDDSELALCESTTRKVLEHYGVEYEEDMLDYYWSMPIALLALYILEHTNYIEAHE